MDGCTRQGRLAVSSGRTRPSKASSGRAKAKISAAMRDEAVAPDERRATRERLQRLLRTGVLTQAEFELLVEPAEPEVG